MRAAVWALALGAVAMSGCSDSAAEVERQPDPVGAEAVVVTCTLDTTTVDHAVVAAATDGVHLTVADETGHELLVRTENTAEEEDRVGLQFPPAGEHVLQLAPGHHLVLCSEQDGPEHMLSPSESDESVELQVVDPTGSWVSGLLECSSGMRSGEVRDYGGGGTGDHSAPVTPPLELVRDDLGATFNDGDVLEQVGYEEQTITTSTNIRLVRDDHTIAVAGVEGGDPYWRIGGWTKCADT